ncbi:MAG: hypothetical protein H6810_02680 [Phycisphaeraceae bacterium]|nr:MAG: hypothetical protein H6810_02680 [Phycisphaeraceae bacterium]
MQTRTRRNAASLHRLAGLAAALSLGLLAACSQSQVAGAPGGAIARLEELAARPASAKARAASLVPPDEALTQIPRGDLDAFIPLANEIAFQPISVDATDVQRAPEEESEDQPEEHTDRQPDDPDRALRLYAEARQFTAAGDSSRAISLLEEASGLSPDVPEIWRALGDARRASGFEASSGAAYLKAADLGIAEPEALLFAGLYALKRDEPERAAGLFFRVLRADPVHTDPLIVNVAAARLGVVLLDMGRVRAGCEALEIGLDLPRAARVPTNVGAEAGAVQRESGELHRRLGDGWCRLGEFDHAAKAYGEAAETTAGSTPAIRERRVYALRAAGRPEEAALLLIDDLRSGTTFDERSLEVLTGVARAVSPRTLLADAIGEIDDGGSPTRRVTLLLARDAALPKGKDEMLLESALADPAATATRPGRRRLLDARLTLERETKGDGLVKLTDRLLASNPSLARPAAAALFSIDPVPGTLWERITAEVPDRGRALALHAELALLLGDPERLAGVLDATSTGPTDPAALARAVAVASAAGRWDTVDHAATGLEALDPDDGGPRDAALLRACEASQHFDEALGVARRLAGRDGATTDDLLRFSAFAHLHGDVDDAAGALDRALKADPYDERVYKALIAFFGPNGPRPDADRTAEIGRSLREHAPAGRLLRQLVTSEMLRRGLVDEVGDRVERLFAEDPADDDTDELVLSRWRRLASADRTNEIDLDPVRDQVKAHPASAGLARLLAEGLVLLDKPNEAIDAVSAFRARTGSLALGRIAERITRETLKDPEAADRMARERIGPPPRSIDGSVELAALEADRLDGTEHGDGAVAAVRDALTGIPDGSGLSDAQQTAVAGVIGKIAGHLNGRRDKADPEHALAGNAVADALACLDWAAARHVPLAPATHDLRLTLLVERRASLPAITDAAAASISEYPQSARAFARRVVDLLSAASREDDAFRWIEKMSFDEDGKVRPDLLVEWFRLVVITASHDRGKELIDTLAAHDATNDAWEALRPKGGIWDTRDGHHPAELGYLLAQSAGLSANSDASEIFLRLTLEYDPRHPWASNDLGYNMLESGGSLEESERLIEIAYEGLPDRASVVDSLGWVRYHRGELEDRADPATGKVIEGAITLLRRAADTLGADDDGTVYDHLGDALYVGGRVDDAIDAWRQAATRANNALSRLRAAGQTGGVRFRELQELATSAAMKRNAIQLGAEPKIAPQRGVEPAPKPDAGAGDAAGGDGTEPGE